MTLKAISNVFLILLAIVPTPVLATSEIVRDPSAWDFAPLLYYDRVVRGTVISASLTQVGSADLSMFPPELRATAGNMKVTVVSVTIKISEVLRGPQDLENGVFLAVGDIAEALDVYQAGSELLVCMKYNPLLKVYYQGSDYGIYMRDGTAWTSMKTARGQRTFSDGDVRARIASMDLEPVALAAELIVKGEVRSVDTTEVAGPDGSTAEMLTVTLNVQSVEKGSFDNDSIQVKALVSGMYLPAWRKHVPTSFAKGQQWLCFLQKNEVGWYPFAGANGFLRISEAGYVYDDRVPFWNSPEKVASAITRAQGEMR